MENIIFWLTNYPRSITGTLKVLSEDDRFNVTCVCLRGAIDTNRIKMGWGYDDLPKVNFIYLDNLDEKYNDIDNLLSNEKKFIHFFGGFRVKPIFKIIKDRVFDRNEKIVIFSERPYLYKANLLKQISLNFIYKVNKIFYGKYIAAYLVMGTQGVEAMRNIGWEDKKLFPFLYHKVFNPKVIENNFINNPIRILYVGQFDERKGLDILIKSIDRLNQGNYILDLVGKNGNLYEKVIKWVKTKDNINYLGVWNTEDLENKICNYDLCVVPSKFDGWGMFTMESILSGVGVITTEQTSSKDLVINSNAGLIIEENNENALTKALEKILLKPSTLITWKSNAKKYRNTISDEIIKKYVVEIIEYTDNNNFKKPKCPWLNRL